MIEFEFNIKMKCDGCGKIQHNHYEIEVQYCYNGVDVENEAEKIMNLYDYYESKDGCNVFCLECSKERGLDV